MTHGSLFSGIGGFDLAAEWAGWTNIFNCEIEPFCKRILKYYWPNAQQYDDIRNTDFTIWRGRIDVLSGGFPCQPYSQAGKRKGTDDERHLWPEMLRAIREIKPKWVVGENVRGIITWSDGLVFEQVCADLEAEGYEVQPYLLPVAGLENAPHERYRTWFIANANSNGRSKDTEQRRSTDSQDKEQSECVHCSRSAENAYKNGWRGNEREKESEAGQLRDISARDNERICSDNREIASERITTDTDQFYGDTSGLCTSGISQLQASGVFKHIPDWRNFPTQSPVCSRNDGFPGIVDIVALLEGRTARQPYITFSRFRQESIKAYGNAVAPPLVYQLFETINECERLGI